MKQHILKYSLILLSGLLIQWWIFDYSSFPIPEYILFTRIRIEGLALVSYIITILIFFQKDLLEKQPDKGMFKLTWEGTSMCFWAEMVFQIIRIPTLRAESINERLYYFLYGTIGITLFATVLSFLIAFQLKTRRTSQLTLLIIAFLFIMGLLKYLFSGLSHPYK